MRGADGRFKRILTVRSREQQGAGRFKRPRRSADALAAAESRGECTAVKQPRKPQPGKANNEYLKGLIDIRSCERPDGSSSTEVRF